MSVALKISQFGILIDLVIVVLFAPQPQLRSYPLRSLLPYHLMRQTQWPSHVLPEDSQNYHASIVLTCTLHMNSPLFVLCSYTTHLFLLRLYCNIDGCGSVLDHSLGMQLLPASIFTFITQPPPWSPRNQTHKILALFGAKTHCDSSQNT